MYNGTNGTCFATNLAIVLLQMVPAAGLEPARACAPRILSPLCLPFHHAGPRDLFHNPTHMGNFYVGPSPESSRTKKYG